MKPKYSAEDVFVYYLALKNKMNGVVPSMLLLNPNDWAALKNELEDYHNPNVPFNNFLTVRLYGTEKVDEGSFTFCYNYDYSPTSM